MDGEAIPSHRNTHAIISLPILLLHFVCWFVVFMIELFLFTQQQTYGILKSEDEPIFLKDEPILLSFAL